MTGPVHNDEDLDDASARPSDEGGLEHVVPRRMYSNPRCPDCKWANVSPSSSVGTVHRDRRVTTSFREFCTVGRLGLSVAYLAVWLWVVFGSG